MFDCREADASCDGGAAVPKNTCRALYRATRSAACAVLALAFLLPRLQAQTTVDGAVRGVALDRSRSVVAGATVTVEDRSRALAFRAVCDARGGFVISHLPAGSYSVTVTAPGFAAVTRNGVAVEVGGTTEMDLRLSVAGVRSVVTVTDAEEEEGAPALERPAGEAVSSVVGARQMDALPLDGRRWQSFALLTPAANAGNEAGNLLSFRGLAVTQNSTTVDGVSDDQSFGGVARGTAVVESREAEETGGEPGGARRSTGSWRRPGAAYTFSQEAVREFRVNAQNYSALYGRGVGGSIATVSKSGTNELHGSGFYTARSSGWGATNPFSIATSYRDGVVTSSFVKPHDLRQQFGGTVGGAAIRNRVYYFYAFDQQRRGFPAISSPGDPDFYRLTPTQRALLANRGVTSAKINDALNYLSGLTGTVARRDDQTIHFLKLDWQASSRNRLSAQYNRLRSAAPAGLRGAAVVDRGMASLGSGYGKLDSTSARWNWTISPHLYNELRFAYGRDLQYEEAQRPLPQEPAIGVGGLAPEVAIGPDGLEFGTPAGVGNAAYPDEERTQAVDTVSWQVKGHLLQMGVDVSFLRERVSALNNTVGSFHYDSGTTAGHAGGLVDWITDYTFDVHAYPNGGCPSITAARHSFCFNSYTQSFGEESVEFRTQEWAGFIEDHWRLARNLTVHAGVRYEYELLPMPQRPNAALDAVFGEHGSTGVFPEDRNNFGPRVGAAWAPFGSRNGMVRVGYGVYYGRVPGATVRSALVNTAQSESSTHVRITPNTVTNCPQVANQGFGYGCAYVAAPPLAVSSTTSAMFFDKRFRAPMVQQGTVAVEHGMGAGMVMGATWLMNLDRQLAGSVDRNIAAATAWESFQIEGGAGQRGVVDGQAFAVPVYAERISDRYGPVTAITSNVSASYNALTLETTRRAGRGVRFRVAWTWSKALDQGQATSGTPGINGQFDPFTAQYDKGLSRLNFPHKVVASAVWEPKLRAKEGWLSREPWLSHMMNGWRLAGVFYETSGRPYSYEIYGGSRLAGGRESMNGSGGAVYLPTVGRNTLRLPDTSRLDLRLARTVRVSEQVTLRATVDAFNVANHVSYTGVQQRAFLVGTARTNSVLPLVFQDAETVTAEGLNARPFGAYTSSTAEDSKERQIQIGLRLEF